MARTEIVLTDTFQEVGTGVATFTVKSAQRGTKLDINDVASETAQHSVLAVPNYQIIQSSAISTFAKGEGVVLIVDDGV